MYGLQNPSEKTSYFKNLFPKKDMLEGFDLLTKNWSEGYLAELRRIAELYIEGHKKQGFQKLIFLVGQAQKTPLANAALSVFYRSHGRLDLAEKALAIAIKSGHFEMSVVLPLIDLYIHSALPESAEKLSKKAFNTFGKPGFLCLDIIQALLMQGKVDEAAKYMEYMITANYFPEIAKTYLPRLYYSIGDTKGFDRTIRFKSNTFDEYQKAWHTLSDEAALQRRKKYEASSDQKKKENRALAAPKAPGEDGQEKDADKKDKLPAAPIGKPLFD